MFTDIVTSPFHLKAFLKTQISETKIQCFPVYSLIPSSWLMHHFNNIFSDIRILMQKTRQSLHSTWNNYLSHDWMPEGKAHRFSVERFYVDLKWSKMDKGVFKNIRKDIRGILDILSKAGKIGLKILVEGNFHFSQLVSA